MFNLCSSRNVKEKLETAVSDREIWSFFTGAMGLDLGLESVGLHPTLTSELDRRFCETIRANRPSLDLIEGDLSNLSGDALRQRRQDRSPGAVFSADPAPQASLRQNR